MQIKIVHYTKIPRKKHTQADRYRHLNRGSFPGPQTLKYVLPYGRRGYKSGRVVTAP